MNNKERECCQLPRSFPWSHPYFPTGSDHYFDFWDNHLLAFLCSCIPCAAFNRMNCAHGITLHVCCVGGSLASSTQCCACDVPPSCSYSLVILKVVPALTCDCTTMYLSSREYFLYPMFTVQNLLTSISPTELLLETNWNVMYGSLRKPNIESAQLSVVLGPHPSCWWLLEKNCTTEWIHITADHDLQH